MSSANTQAARRHRAGQDAPRTTRPRTLSPLWRDRLSGATRPGWARTVYARRTLAALLVVLAAVLAVRGDPSTATGDVVVAARDLPPGHVLVAADLRVVSMASRSLPDGAVGAVSDVTGRAVAGAVRAGEPFTDVRVVGPSLAALAAGSADATSVPVRLTDPDVADLLRPGDRVNVLALGERAGNVRVLAEGAVVLAVQPGDAKRPSGGRLVLLGLAPDGAATVAAASLESAVTVTFR